MAAKLGPWIERAACAAYAAYAAYATGATDAPACGSRAVADLETWLNLLAEWNARVDLTAARTPEELVDLMVADAMVVQPRIEPRARVIDVGTGAGAPGLALALLRPDLRVTLVEPAGKRASFLRTVLGTLPRTDIQLARARGETFAGRRAWDVAMSRATLPPPAWLDLAASLAAPGGSIWLFLAKQAPPEHPRAQLAEQVGYAWPLTGAERVAARYVVV
jgi:16S rRNA (guanine527-N7)-methyltransferase